MCKFFQYALITFSILSISTVYSSTEKYTPIVNALLGETETLSSNLTTKVVPSKDLQTLPAGYDLSISWSGAAFRYPWHFGVAAYLQKKYKPQLAKTCFIGTSAGAMTSALLASEVDIEKDVMGATVDAAGNFAYAGNAWLDRVYQDPLITNTTTGVYGHILKVMGSKKYPLLPECCWQKVTNKATFTLTNITSWWPASQRINQFGSKQDVMDFGFASGHIPWLVDGNFSATVSNPAYSDQKYLDGGFLDNQPVFKNNDNPQQTIRIWPYMDEIRGNTLLSFLSLYGNSDMQRNRRMYETGYNFAKTEDEKPNNGIWAPLSKIQVSSPAK